MEKPSEQILVTPEVEAGRAHFRNAQADYDSAIDMLEKEHDFIPHTNPAFRSAIAQARDFAMNSLNSLEYAEKFGGIEQQQIDELREKIQAALVAIQAKAAARKSEMAK